MGIKKQEVLDNLGLQIKVERTKKRMNQGDLAKRIGYAQSALSAWEAGKKCPSYWAIKKIEEVLGVEF